MPIGHDTAQTSNLCYLVLSTWLTNVSIDGPEEDDMHGRPDPEVARFAASHRSTREEEADTSRDKLYD